jgi:hypothetical protein
VCLYAIDAQIGWLNIPLGCRAITTQLAEPVGNWETLTASGSTLTVTVGGWAFDPDDHGRSVPLHVYVDGNVTVIDADQIRADVGAAFPGAGDAHGFSESLAAGPGEHRVCVYAINTDPAGGYTALGCRMIVVPPMTAAEAIQSAWEDWGTTTGPLGASLGAAQGGLARGGYHREFQNGDIYWSPTTGAWVVLDGLIRNDWVRIGAETSGLGYPISDTFCGLVDGGCGQHFEGGALYSHNSSVYQVVGVFLEAWADHGWEGGPLGYPTSGATRYGDGHLEQQFEHGNMYWTARDGVSVIM